MHRNTSKKHCGFILMYLNEYFKCFIAILMLVSWSTWKIKSILIMISLASKNIVLVQQHSSKRHFFIISSKQNLGGNLFFYQIHIQKGVELHQLM